MGILVVGASSLTAKLKGVSEITEKGVERGLMKGGLLIQREAQKLTPIDTAALKNSARTKKKGKGFGTVVRITFGTKYGIYVHENLDANHPVGESKFLEKAWKRNIKKVTTIVREEAKL